MNADKRKLGCVASFGLLSLISLVLFSMFLIYIAVQNNGISPELFANQFTSEATTWGGVSLQIPVIATLDATLIFGFLAAITIWAGCWETEWCRSYAYSFGIASIALPFIAPLIFGCEGLLCEDEDKDEEIEFASETEETDDNVQFVIENEPNKVNEELTNDEVLVEEVVAEEGISKREKRLAEKAQRKAEKEAQKQEQLAQRQAQRELEEAQRREILAQRQAQRELEEAQRREILAQRQAQREEQLEQKQVQKQEARQQNVSEDYVNINGEKMIPIYVPEKQAHLVKVIIADENQNEVAQPEVKEVVKVVEVVKEVPVEVIKEVPVEVIKEVPVASEPAPVKAEEVAKDVELKEADKKEAHVIGNVNPNYNYDEKVESQSDEATWDSSWIFDEF